jgi:hypothetical protein
MTTPKVLMLVLSVACSSEGKDGDHAGHQQQRH